MNKALSICLVAVVLRVSCPGQEPNGLATTPSSRAADFRADRQPSDGSAMHARTHPSNLTAGPQAPGMKSKFSYYLAETFFNPSALTAPAFRAGIRMSNPPGNGATRYPAEWRQGAEGFGRNYADAFASRVSAHTAQFLAGAVLREDPRYAPSASHGFFARSAHAIA